MKKLLFSLLTVLCFSYSLSAQTEIKVSPVALLFTGIGVGVEYGVKDDFGIDLSTLITGEDALVWLSGKYYLNPRQGLDRFHLGLFVGGTTYSSPGIGFLLGTKIASRSNKIVFEVGAGIGRTFDNNVIPYGRLTLGYRIGGRK